MERQGTGQHDHVVYHQMDVQHIPAEEVEDEESKSQEESKRVKESEKVPRLISSTEKVT